jgi:CRISPR system Cascade subunit CasC
MRHLQEKTQASSFLGTKEFNSATLYRYANVTLHTLKTELNDKDAVLTAVKAFVEGFLMSMPTGGQNNMATPTLPRAAMVTLRTDRAVSLAEAFETPVTGEGLVENSISAFVEYTNEAYKDFCKKPAVSLVVGKGFAPLGERMSIEELLDRVGVELDERYGGF